MGSRSTIAPWLAAAAAAIFSFAASASAAEIKTLGKLDLIPGVGVVVIASDPIVQRDLNDALETAHRDARSQPGRTITLTVTVTQQMLAPGVSMNRMFPGDPSMVELLKEAGVDAPPLGDSGNQPIDPFELEARRQQLDNEDPNTASFREYLARKQNLASTHDSTYESIPKDQLYDTVIVARATLEGSPNQFKIVAVVHAGDDARAAKQLVALEIANSMLH